LAGHVAVLHEGKLLAYDTPERVQTAAGAGTLEQSIEKLVRHAGAAS
jgi:hypothetical protein